MKQAILVASFGTTHLDTLEKNICAVEEDIRRAFPDTDVFRAFTSPTVRRRLAEKYGMAVRSVTQALEEIAGQGYTHVLLQPTLLLPGEEYDKLCAAAREATGIDVTVGRPLLWEEEDLRALALILREAYPMPDDRVLLAMGHGTAHGADDLYRRLRAIMGTMGMELCTVEGSIGFDAAVEAMLARPQRKAHLVPLLLVAGDHSKNDMAGEEPDSLRSRLERAGFDVTFSLQGLGELPAVRRIFTERLKELAK